MRTWLILLVSLGIGAGCLYAEEKQSNSAPLPFNGEIKEDQVNVRLDSTTGSEIICSVFRGEPVEVVSERFDWYKIRLPKSSPSYIKKTLVSVVDDRTVKVLKDRVNIRLRPNEDSPILGKVSQDEVLRVRKSAGEWFAIDPVYNSFGWIHKQFVLPFRTGLVPQPAAQQPTKESIREQPPAPAEISETGEIVVEGIIQPYGKVFNRKATHKLVHGQDTFLLQGDPVQLNALNWHHVKITGKLVNPASGKSPSIISVEKMELTQ